VQSAACVKDDISLQASPTTYVMPLNHSDEKKQLHAACIGNKVHVPEIKRWPETGVTPCLKKRPTLWLAITLTHMNGF